MPRAAKSEGITIGFLGTGAMEVNAATTLLEEYINASVKPEEPARFLFPLTTDEFSDSLMNLAKMAKASRIAYEVITSADDKGRRAHTEIASGAARQYQNVADIWTQMEAILVEAPQAALVVLWDDKREAEIDRIASKFIDAGIKVMDLTDGMRVLGEDEGQEGEEPVVVAVGPVEEAEDEDEADEESEGLTPEDYEPLDETEAVIEATSVALHNRAAMEKMSHAEVKDIAVSMGLPVRKARENMIVAILEAQGGPQAVVSGAVESDLAVGVTTELISSGFDWEGLREVLDEFGTRFFTGLEEFSMNFMSRLEGTQFNLKPEEPMVVDEPEPEPAPTRRRLVRPQD